MTNKANKISLSEVQNRIFEIIDSMPEIEMRNFLIGLEKWKQSKHNHRRKHPRKDTSIYALFETNGLSFREYIKNLSDSGLFIDTNIPVSSNNKLFVQFVHPDSKNVVRLNGKIVRVDSKGLGIQFDKPRSDI
jgi:Tfp pilus assembly protein PilZ